MASATDEAKFSRYRVRDDRHDKGTNGRVVRRGFEHQSATLKVMHNTEMLRSSDSSQRCDGHHGELLPVTRLRVLAVHEGAS